METAQKTITVTATVNAPVEKVWKFWNEPEHIKGWAFASDDWHAPHAENDLRVDGKFTTTMAAKDGSFSFDFWGTYTDVQENAYIAYTMGDGRKTWIKFTSNGDNTEIEETFEPETENPIEMQQGGWKMILNNFKKYAEAKA